MKIKCIDKNSKEFPNSLKQLSKCPKQLYVLGDESILSKFSLAVIGSRNCSSLGKIVAENITKELNKSQIPITSGFARGIDTIAYKTCLENNSKTIAILGGGHGKIYPKENEYLMKEIVEKGGSVISEYPPEYPTLPNNFRERNRIIAALSDGVVLIEAKVNSGSLITIKYAKDLNKKIFVVPGSINDELYEGSNLVLKEGAYCIRNAKDILEKYKMFQNEKCISEYKTQKQKEVAEELKNVYAQIRDYPKSISEICAIVKEPTNKILAKLIMLEVNGAIKKIDEENYIRVK